MIETELLKVLLAYFSSMVKIRRHTFWPTRNTRSCLSFNFDKTSDQIFKRDEYNGQLCKKNFLEALFNLKGNRLMKCVFLYSTTFGGCKIIIVHTISMYYNLRSGFLNFRRKKYGGPDVCFDKKKVLKSEKVVQ